MSTQKEADSCWVCHRWAFCLFFWQPEKRGLGVMRGRSKPVEYKDIGIDMPNFKRLVDKIRLHNAETYMKEADVPLMFCSATNWKPKPFMHILDFLNSIEDVDTPDFNLIAQSDAMDEFNYINLEQEPESLQV